MSEYSCSASRAFVELSTIFGPLDDILDIFSTTKKTIDELNSNDNPMNKILSTVSAIKSVGKSLASMYSDITGTDIQKNVSARDEKILSGKFNSFIQHNSRTDILRDLFSRIEFDIKLVNPALRVSNLAADPIGTVDNLLGQFQSGTIQKKITDFINDPIQSITSNLTSPFEQSSTESDLLTLRGCKLGSRSMTININSLAIMEQVSFLARTLTEGQNLRKRVIGA